MLAGLIFTNYFTAMTYFDIFIQGFSGYYHYLLNEILHPQWHNYFYWLLGWSLFCWGLEWRFPWRKAQSPIRRDFWLDGFYMFFNFFLFSLIGYNAISGVVAAMFNDALYATLGWQNLVALQLQSLPVWIQLLTMLIVRDFVQWNIHRLLHRFDALWQIHKVHHSVQEMGFAAHLRYHFGETIIYRTLEYIPLAMLGFGISDFFVVHIFTLAIGHLNHSNIYLPLGKLRYLFNSPQMHLWHHAQHLPDKYRYGTNFGLTLSIWDYLFGTAYQPHNQGDIPLGFADIEHFPDTFVGQALYPIKSTKE